MAQAQYAQPRAGQAGAYVEDAPAAVRRISWGAIIAGTVIVLAIQLLLSMLGVGIGTSTIDPAQGESPEGQTIGIGAGIWWVVCSLIAVFAGGWVAGRLAGMPTRMDGLLHGLITWAVSLILLLYLLTTALSSLIGGALGAVGSAMQAAGQGAQQAAQATTDPQQAPGVLGEVQRQLRDLMNQAQQQVQPYQQDAKQLAQDPRVRQVVEKAVTAGPEALSPNDRNAALDAIAQNTNVSRQEAEQKLNDWQRQYQEAKEQAKQAGEKAAEGVAQASIWSFIALLIGAVVGAVGGWIGSPHDLRTRGAYAA